MNDRLTKENKVKYKSDLGDIEAILTNEVAVKYLHIFLEDRNRKLDRIIALCTEEFKKYELNNFD